MKTYWITIFTVSTAIGLACKRINIFGTDTKSRGGNGGPVEYKPLVRPKFPLVAANGVIKTNLDEDLKILLPAAAGYAELNRFYRDLGYPRASEPHYKIPPTANCQKALYLAEVLPAPVLEPESPQAKCVADLLPSAKASVDGNETFQNAMTEFYRQNLYLYLNPEYSDLEYELGKFSFYTGYPLADAKSLIEKDANDALQSIPLAHVVMIPTVHFLIGTEQQPACYSHTLVVRQLLDYPEIGFNNFFAANPDDLGKDGFFASGSFLVMKPSQIKPLPYYHLNLIAALFENPKASFSQLVLAPAFFEKPDFDKLEDDDYEFSCGKGNLCAILRGADVPTADGCRAFDLMPAGALGLTE